MRILVGYASKYGSTRQIAQRIAEKLRDGGHKASSLDVWHADPTSYDAFVIGSSAYINSWLKNARAFVFKHRELLAQRPVWLFSSGPLGFSPVDPQGRDQLDTAEPREFAEFADEIRPRGTKVFYGKLDPARLNMRDRFIRAMPGATELMPAGDFRDWEAIEAWAEHISLELPIGVDTDKRYGRET